MFVSVVICGLTYIYTFEIPPRPTKSKAARLYDTCGLAIAQWLGGASGQEVNAPAQVNDSIGRNTDE